MYEAIKNFAQQFAFGPVIQNANTFKKRRKFAVVGMGGSNLAADLIKRWKPNLDIITHRNYGLPPKEDLDERLVILHSYSGNTEEVIGALKLAREKKLGAVAISMGGTLLELARKYSLPFIQIPDTNIQPRAALGFNMRALLKAAGEEAGLQESNTLVHSLKPEEYEQAGKNLAERLREKIPIIYSSEQNRGIAYNWKIKFNETGKIPAFCNVFPELNHNEMAGWSASKTLRGIVKNFFFILLKDNEDDRRIAKRMEVFEKLFRERGFPVKTIRLADKNIFKKIFSSLLLADWAAYYTAVQNSLDPEQVPIIGEFKKLIAKEK